MLQLAAASCGERAGKGRDLDRQGSGMCGGLCSVSGAYILR